MNEKFNKSELQTKRKSRKSKPRKTKSESLKPYPDFPLGAHATGRWYKKIKGTFYYFGPIDDPEGALKKFNLEWPYLSEGRTPPSVDVGDGCTVMLLCNSFLTAKLAKLNSGELSSTTFLAYQRGTDHLIRHFGKNRRVDDLTPNDFRSFRSKLAKGAMPSSLSKHINVTRIILKFAIDERLIDRPIHYGQAFDKPSAKTLRKARNEAGAKLFSADEIHRIIDASDPVMKAMVLLGVNCGFGNMDCSSLTQSVVDLDSGWIDYPRPKTQVNRRVPLWPETVEAVRTAIAKRRKPKDPSDADLCFLTKKGNRWVRTKGKTYPKEGEEDKLLSTNAISGCFGYMLKKLDMNGCRGLGFYTLRHVFETIGGECKDQVAVNSIMGHVDNSMAGVYRETISDERLRAVTDTVHNWLFPETVRPVDDLVTSTTSQAASLRDPAIVVIVEYDSPAGERKSRRFDDQCAARRLFVAKEVAGKNPTVRVVDM